MAQSVKLSDGSYIDTEGIYDVTQGKTQADINSAQAIVNAKCGTGNDVLKVRFSNDSSGVSTVWYFSDCLYQLKAYTSEKRISMIKYDNSTGKYTTIWDITS